MTSRCKRPGVLCTQRGPLVPVAVRTWRSCALVLKSSTTPQNECAPLRAVLTTLHAFLPAKEKLEPVQKQKFKGKDAKWKVPVKALLEVPEQSKTSNGDLGGA